MAKLAFVLMLFVASPALAGEGLDVKEWLSRPGVKLLAVEFYATWCKPCMKAVPRWKELHEKYRGQGFRLVVISVQDPDGACVNPGWNPDDIVCDIEGDMSEAFGVGNTLPAAFLWSWRGTLLVRKGHVEEVEAAVEKELRKMPRVTLDEKMEPSLRELLRGELANSAKVDVVAGEEEQEALERIRKGSHELKYADNTTCKVGKQLAANSLLRAKMMKAGAGRRLVVQLYNAETGCLSASAGVYWNEERPELPIAEAVAELVNSLRVPIERPRQRTAPREIAEREIGEEAEEWDVGPASGVVVAFESEPPGAVVMLDGKLLCQQTPCSKLLAPGRHALELQKENYLPVKEQVRLSKETKTVRRTLTPDFGWLTVNSTPTGLPVTLDGKPLGTTPVKKRRVGSGPHRVLVTALAYYHKGKEVVIGRGEHEEIDVAPSPRQGALEVFAQDQRGNDLVAAVTVDGRKVGETPYTGKLLIGDHEVQVVQGRGSWERTVTVREKEVERLDAKLKLEEALPEPQPDRGGRRDRLFHLGLSLSEGVVLAGGEPERTGVGGALSAWLKWSWFRWQPLSVGISFEGPNPLFLGTGAAFDIVGGLFARTLFELAFADSKSYWGILVGAGYGFDLGSGWHLDAEIDATFWPGEVVAAPVEARLGVRYGF